MVPERLTVEALVQAPSGMVLVIGQAWLADGAEVVPDHEHDEFAWWPAEVERWPAEADIAAPREGGAARRADALPVASSPSGCSR